MAEIIKIRSSIFIPEALCMYPRIDSSTDPHYKLGSNANELSPYTINTMHSRFEQEVIVDFSKRDIFTYCHTDT